MHCRELTRDHSKTFYFGSRFFPLTQRQAVWAVYAACRNGDDIADEPGGGPVALSDWWARVQSALEGQVAFSQAGPHPVDVALGWAAGQYCIPVSAFGSYIRASGWTSKVRSTATWTTWKPTAAGWRASSAL